MNTKNWKKGEVIAAIALLLLSALVFAGTVNALEPQTGEMRFVLIYHDVNTGDSDFLSGVSVSLFEINGKYVSSATSSSSGVVKFENIPYGNYALKTDGQVKGNYFYDESFATVKFDSSGLHTLDGNSFWSLNVDRYALPNVLNLTVEKNGEIIPAQVSVYFKNAEIASKSIDTYGLFNLPDGKVTLKITYLDGGVSKAYYRELMVSGNMNLTINVGNAQKIWGIVEDSTTGLPVATNVHITLINETSNQFNVLQFPGGPFSFYLVSPQDYKVVVTADGYGIKTYTASELMGSTPAKIELNPVENDVDYTITLSEDLKTINMVYTMDITNETILANLPYNDTGVLYYQLKFLGVDNAYLEQYFTNNVAKYTTNLITLGGNIYELSTYTSDWKVINAGNEEFKVTIDATYVNENISKNSLLKNGMVELDLYGGQTTYLGAKIVYKYTIQLPSDLERSNEVRGANVNGYVNSLTITDIKTTPVKIDLKERKSPAMNVDPLHFKFGWTKMENKNYVVNQSANNYTIVVPAGKDVWFNASKVVYDVVRNKVDAENTTYTWIFDGQIKASGKGVYNVTKSFLVGKHTLQLKVADIGGNTNETNITILADAYYPTVNMVIEYPSGKMVAKVNMAADMHSLKYNVYGKNGTVGIVNGTATIPVTLTFNETQEIIYDASKSYDTYDGKNKVALPLNVVWNFNGVKTTGLNKTYAFEKPTRNGTYTISVKFTDEVNNTITVKFKVIIKDITPPVPKVNVTSNGKPVTEIKEGEQVTFDASASYDPDNGTIASYKWIIKDHNYKVLNESSGDFKIISGSFTSPKLTLEFTHFGTYYVILNITDAAGNYKVYNKTFRVAPVRPDLSVTDVQIKGDRVEGSPITFVVNITNNGNKNANVYYVILLVDGKEVLNKTFYNLSAGSSVVDNITYSFSGANNYSVTVKVYCPDEPASYTSDNKKEMNINIAQAPWKTPALVIGVIAIIIVLGYIGWIAQKKKAGKGKFTKRTKEKKEKKGKK